MDGFEPTHRFFIIIFLAHIISTCILVNHLPCLLCRVESQQPPDPHLPSWPWRQPLTAHQLLRASGQSLEGGTMTLILQARQLSSARHHGADSKCALHCRQEGRWPLGRPGRSPPASLPPFAPSWQHLQLFSSKPSIHLGQRLFLKCVASITA